MELSKLIARELVVVGLAVAIKPLHLAARAGLEVSQWLIARFENAARTLTLQQNRLDRDIERYEAKAEADRLVKGETR